VWGDEDELDFPKLYLDFVGLMATNLGADKVVELSYWYPFSDPRNHTDAEEQILMN
jgi:hypothetical protein